MRAFFYDVQFSLRSLRRTPGFSLVAIAILGLGIASSIVIFSLVDSALLRPLPYPDAGRMVIVHWQTRQSEISSEAFFLLRNRARALQNTTAIYPIDVGVNLAGAGTPHYIKALRVSQDFFQLMGIEPMKGRAFRPEEDLPGGPRTAVLSYSVWSQAFDRDSSILGHQLKVNGESYTVIGVMPPEFHSYPEAEAWLPLQLSEATANPGNDYRIIARLRAGIPWQLAQKELITLSEEYRLKYPQKPGAGNQILVLHQLQDFLVRDVREYLEILFAAVSLLLVIACTNLALLLLVRVSARNEEIAIRAALGASRGRLMLRILSESLALSFPAGLLGLIAAKELLPFVPFLLSIDIPLTTRLTVNPHILLFALTLSLITSIIIGLGPAFRISRIDLNEVLRQTARGTGTSKEQTYTEHILISTQTTLTLTLLAGATFLFQNFMTLRLTPPGFDARGVTAVQVSLAGQHYATTAQSTEFLDQVFQQLRNSSRIESVAAVNGLPLETGLNLPMFPTDSPEKLEHAAQYRPVTPEYFSVLRIPLRGGRVFSDADVHTSTLVAIVNETLARQWWPDGKAIGHFVAVGQEYGNPFSDKARLVVGVSADVHEAGLGRPTPPTVFIPAAQTPDNTMAFINRLFLVSILVRNGNASPIAGRIRAAVTSADPELPVAALRPLSDVVAGSIAPERFYVSLTTAFGAVALILTVIGLYGILRYRVSRRTREIAVRMALGSTRENVVASVMQETVVLVSVGLVLGMAGGVILEYLLKASLSTLHGSYIKSVFGAAVLMLVVATLTSLSTAFRAASIQPMTVLRNE